MKIIFNKFTRNIDLEGSRVNCGIMAHRNFKTRFSPKKFR
jgi:hypothetical protein